MRNVLRALLLLFVCSAVCAASDAVPHLYQPLVPTAVPPGHATFTLTVNGTGFVSGAVVRWNAVALATTFVNESRLTASVPAVEVASAGTGTITVANPAGRVVSNPVYFVVRAATEHLTWSTTTEMETQRDPESLIAADVSGDGKLDVVVANLHAHSVSVILGRGDGTFQRHFDYQVDNSPADVATGDFNGDGVADLAVVNQPRNGPGTVSILLGVGGGRFAGATTFATRPHPSCQAVADFNGDGNLDILVNYSGANGFSVLLGNGDGTFQPLMDSATGQYVRCPAVGDFNGDGKLDFAAVHGGKVFAGGFDVFLGNGDGTFQPSQFFTTHSPEVHSIAVADIDGDAKLDLAIVGTVADSNGSVDTYVGDGNGNFQLHNSRTFSNCPSSPAIGDFNGDGFLDIGSFDGCASTFDIGLGDGTGYFADGVFPTSLAGTATATGDFNGDGKLDLVTVENEGVSLVGVILQ